MRFELATSWEVEERPQHCDLVLDSRRKAAAINGIENRCVRLRVRLVSKPRDHRAEDSVCSSKTETSRDRCGRAAIDVPM